jgi:hypothetical protein
MSRTRCLRICAGRLCALALLSVSPLSAEDVTPKTREAEVLAILDHLDKNYPYFDLKAVKKDWDFRKREWRKRASKLDDDAAMMQLVADFLPPLRDGGMAIENCPHPLPVEQRFWTGLSIGLCKGGKAAVTYSEGAPVIGVGVEITKIGGMAPAKWIEAETKRIWDGGGKFSSRQQIRCFVMRWLGYGEQDRKISVSYGTGPLAGEQELACGTKCEKLPPTGPLPEGLVKTSDPFTSYKNMGNGVGYIRVEEVGSGTDRGVDESREAMMGCSFWLVDVTDADEGGMATLAAQTPYRGKFAILVSAATKGHGERYVRDMVENIGVRIFGENTAGWVSYYAKYPLPRNLGELVYSTKTERGVGKGIEFNGIAPHVEIQWDQKDLADGVSTFVKTAVEDLAAKSKK